MDALLQVEAVTLSQNTRALRKLLDSTFTACSRALVVSSGGAPTPAGTSVFTKHNWDMGMGYLWLNGWGIYHLMGGAFMAYWVGHL